MALISNLHIRLLRWAAVVILIFPAIQAQQQLAKIPTSILKENDSALALILSDDDSSVSLGSGFFIGDGTAVVTNFHVLAGAKKVVLKTGNGQVLYSGSLYGFDQKKDLMYRKYKKSFLP